MANTQDGARFRQVLRGYDKAEVDATVARLERQLAERTAERDAARLAASEAAEKTQPASPERDWDEFGERVSGLLRDAEEVAAAEIARGERAAAELIRAAERRVVDLESEAAGRFDEALEERRHRAEERAAGIVAEATAHAERIMTEAGQRVEALEAKALALEVRRDELEAELAELRAEITHREPPPAPVVEPPAAAATTPDEVGPQRAPEWASAVRIIPPADEDPEPEPPAEPVEALEVMEEVRRLHEEPPSDQAEPTEAPTPEAPAPEARPNLTVVPAPTDPDTPAPADEPVQPAVDDDPEPLADPEPDEPDAPVGTTDAAPDTERVADVDVDVDADGDADGDADADADGDAPADEAAVDTGEQPELSTGGLDDLFASLRGEPEPTPEPTESTAPIDPPPTASPEPVLRRPLDLPDHTPILLPITNRALRVLKRQLADIQNIALEGIRLDPDGWRPSRSDLSGPLSPVLHEVRTEAFEAGIEAIADEFRADVEVTGAPSAKSAMAGDLAASLERALMRGIDGPSRSAEVSRVFRSWRSDGAERHLRMEAIRAFHEGAREAASALGFGVAVVLGRPCPTCAEVVEGSGDTLPPIHDGCRCTVVVTP